MKTTTTKKQDDYSIIALDKFIQATRDSGYKSTSNAIAELVDNSIQAGAKKIRISISNEKPEEKYPLQILVYDDGSGMDPFTLRQALRFGGSTRFNDRKGLGRYGMGLPNSSLSQARRVTVYTWQVPGDVYASYLDVDEIAAGKFNEVPVPVTTDIPFKLETGKTGTVIAWTNCDRLDNSRISTLARKIAHELGRQFRYFVWDGIDILVNGEGVGAVDPLFLHPSPNYSGATLFGDPIEYEIQLDPVNDTKKVGLVKVRFSELPVREWHSLSNEEKRRLSISKGAGVSIVRAKREVDYGWFFLSDKRRENYDDWWRCEIQFDPILDEAFGITHTKQQIRPKAHLLEVLAPDIEAAARALNARVRKSHMDVKVSEQFSHSEKIAHERDGLLKPLPNVERERDHKIFNDLKKKFPEIEPVKNKTNDKKGKKPEPVHYKIVESATRDTTFFTYAVKGNSLILALNPHHPFYKAIYKPLIESDSPQIKEIRSKLELLLLAAARSEAAEEDEKILAELERSRLRWSNILATFLNG